MIRFLQQDNRVTKLILRRLHRLRHDRMVITWFRVSCDNRRRGDAAVYATVRSPGLLGTLRRRQQDDHARIRCSGWRSSSCSSSGFLPQYLPYLLSSAMAQAGSAGGARDPGARG